MDRLCNLNYCVQSASEYFSYVATFRLQQSHTHRFCCIYLHTDNFTDLSPSLMSFFSIIFRLYHIEVNCMHSCILSETYLYWIKLYPCILYGAKLDSLILCTVHNEKLLYGNNICIWWVIFHTFAEFERRRKFKTQNYILCVHFSLG